MRVFYVLLSVVVVGLSAVACGAHGSGKPTPCALSREDSVFVSSDRPVYRDCAVDRKARQTSTNIHPDLASSMSDRGGSSRCYSTELAFVVNERGNPEAETARVVRATNQEFGEAWLKIVPQLKYEPAMKDGTPVRQIVHERFSVSTATIVVKQGDPMPSGPPPRGSYPTC